MSTSLIEDEMRKALFGSCDAPAQGTVAEPEAPAVIFCAAFAAFQKEKTSFCVHTQAESRAERGQ